MEGKLIEYIRVELIKASKKIDSILDNVETESFNDKDKSSLFKQKGKISLLSQMITDFEFYDKIDEEGILCGQY